LPHSNQRGTKNRFTSNFGRLIPGPNGGRPLGGNEIKLLIKLSSNFWGKHWRHFLKSYVARLPKYVHTYVCAFSSSSQYCHWPKPRVPKISPENNPPKVRRAPKISSKNLTQFCQKPHNISPKNLSK
jgi:hypothetical protein